MEESRDAWREKKDAVEGHQRRLLMPAEGERGGTSYCGSVFYARAPSTEITVCGMCIASDILELKGSGESWLDGTILKVHQSCLLRP